MPKSCIVVGAGIAGLVAARHLQQVGCDVLVLDKGRGVGGRMATRRIGEAVFDHGAQYFTARTQSFQDLVESWLEAQVAREWTRGFSHADGTTATGNYPRYVGTQGMNTLPKMLAHDLTVLTSTQVQHIALTDAQWELTALDLATQSTQTYRADMLLMTPPAEQTLALLNQAQGFTLPDSARLALDAIRYDPCFAIMAVLDRPSCLHDTGGIFAPSATVSWMADNQHKGISPVPCVTVHATGAFTQAHYDTPPSEVATLLLESVSAYLGEAHVLDCQVQRWRYSQPSVLHPEKTLFLADPLPLAIAGDAFEGARVEGAMLSGLAAAQQLLPYAIEE